MSSQAGDDSDRQKKFFCHSCNNSFHKHPDAEFVCPECQLGFIEEMPENVEQHQQDNFEEPSFMSILAPIISGSLSGASSFVTNEPTDGSSGSGGNRRGGRRQMLSFEDILQEILVSITEGANSGRAPMFFNPADYAWGREGLDTIVTQLLNQMDNTGPPPLEKEKIDKIPKCEITQEQVDSKLQCSVCWEDFQLNEKVRQLDCLHVYHEGCIIPWLELHGTCPVCRKCLVPEDESNSSNAPNNPLRFSLSGQASASSTSQQHGHQESTSNNSSNSSETQTTPEASGSRRLRDDFEFDFD